MRDKSSEVLAAKISVELTRLRKEKGISHAKLSEKTGLSRSAISFIENQKRDPRLISSLKIAKALGVSLADIIVKFEK